jgi:prepilin-type N-terminal cleavage/methylation domain-containing protein
MKKNQGFTLIEVLVVIAIISLMMVWLLPQIAGGQRSVDEAQCRKQLQDIYAASVVYKSRNSNRLPSGRGVTFFWQLWDSGAIPKTDDGRRLFFCPEVIPVASPRALDVKDSEIKALWPDADSFTSEDTHYAARARAHSRTMTRDGAIWFADDNEGASNHASNVINVLYSNGKPGSIQIGDLKEEGYWEGGDDPAYFFPVGEGSPHPELSKLTAEAEGTGKR